MTEQPVDQPTDGVDIPAQFVIDQLRNEIARLNDERLTLNVQLQFTNQVVGALQAQLQATATEYKDAEGNVVKPAGVTPEDPNQILTGPADTPPPSE